MRIVGMKTYYIAESGKVETQMTVAVNSESQKGKVYRK